MFICELRTAAAQAFLLNPNWDAQRGRNREGGGGQKGSAFQSIVASQPISNRILESLLDQIKSKIYQ